MTKNILDDFGAIQKLDKQNMLGSLGLLGEQMWSIYETNKKLKLPAAYKNINKILVVGMGGSEINWHVAKTLFFADLKLPLEIVSDYHIPAWVDKNTLVVGSSYSGTTEEPVNAVLEAKKRGAKLVILTSGGKLWEWGKKNKLPVVYFTEDFNPCQQPRIGIGYMVMGAIILLNKLGVLKVNEKELEEMFATAKNFGKKFTATVPAGKNPAKWLAKHFTNKTVWYVGAEHLSGNAHVGANQVNENSKRFASYFLIPELNHHLLEGMINPKTNKSNLLFVFLESKLYSPKIQKRFQITKDILEKNDIEFVSYTAQSKNKLTQVVEILAFTGHSAFYGAVAAGIDPSAIPYVNFFKAQLKK